MIDIRSVSKSYRSTRALNDVSLSIGSGEVRALVGRNGAGKSTLVGLLTGLVKPDSGEVLISGILASDTAAVATVYQHSRLVKALTVAENIAIGNYPLGAGGVIKWRLACENAERLLDPWGQAHLASLAVEKLDPVQAKVVEICRALAGRPRVLLLDEPTAGLERRDATRLFQVIDQLKRDGVTLVYVSHHLDEIYRVCDSATVLRDGRHIVSASLDALPKAALVRAMVGDAVESSATAVRQVTSGTTYPMTAARAGLSIDNLSVAGVVEKFSLDVLAGECVGIAGIEGSGKAEIGAAIAGLVTPSFGSIAVEGISYRLGNVRAAIEAGIGYVPPDRHAQGLVPHMSVSENSTMTAMRQMERRKFALPRILYPSDLRRRFSDLAARWQIVSSSPNQPISELSGGNQQKCVMARALATGPKVIVLQNPTAGVDVSAKASIMSTLKKTLADGASVVVISEDADDFVLASRIVVVTKGRARRTLGAGWTDHELVSAMQGD